MDNVCIFHSECPSVKMVPHLRTFLARVWWRVKGCLSFCAGRGCVFPWEIQGSPQRPLSPEVRPYYYVFFSTMIPDPLIRNLNKAWLPGGLALGGGCAFRFPWFLFLVWTLASRELSATWFLQQGIQKINLLHSAKFVQIRQLIYVYLYTSHKNYAVVTLLLVLLLSMIKCSVFNMPINSTFWILDVPSSSGLVWYFRNT